MTILDCCANMISLCSKKEQLKICVEIISFILGTIDMVTDWINWNQWRFVGGYDQHYFIDIFTTAFFCVAVVGTVLWIAEVFILITRFSEYSRRYKERSKTGMREYGDHIKELEHSSWLDRLGFIVRMMTGLFEDLPVVILLYLSVSMPLCGVPAKRERYSPTTIATVVSSMLNSMWTMFVLYWELCGCNKKLSNAQCCCTTIRAVYESEMLMSVCYCGCCGCVTTSNCGCICLGQIQKIVNNISSYLVSRKRTNNKNTCKTITLRIGKTILLGITFAIFLLIFIMGAMNLTLTYRNPLFERSIITLDPTIRSIKADKIGPGLDSGTDAAMFVTMVYELPNWYHVGLYDNRNVNIANSASVHQIQNRLSIGQFNELEHLKEGTLTKAIPCCRVFPFLNRIDESMFQLDNSQKLNITNFSNCKLIFRLRYYPTNNNYNPFKKFIHRLFKNITVEWGIYVQDSETCPTGFQPLPVSSLLTDSVKQDIINYTCSPTCINVTDVCHKASYGKFEQSHFGRSLSTMTSEPKFYLTINDQEFTDSCLFKTNFQNTTDILWPNLGRLSS